MLFPVPTIAIVLPSFPSLPVWFWYTNKWKKEKNNTEKEGVDCTLFTSFFDLLSLAIVFG